MKSRLAKRICCVALAGFMVFGTCWQDTKVSAEAVMEEAATEADTGDIQTQNLGTGVSEVPGTETPSTEVPGTETPSTEVPGTETPGTEVPGTETPGTEVPGTETPGTEVPGTETPGTEVPGTETPSTEVPETETPSTEKTEADNTETPAALQTVNRSAEGESFDVNAPVIENFVFEENGQSLNADDTLHFYVDAYDSDSGIESVTVSISTDTTFYIDKCSCTKTEEDNNRYAGTLVCSELEGTNFYISRVQVTDKKGNYANWEVTKDGQNLYTYTADCAPAVTATISNYQMTVNDADQDGTLSVGDSVTYSADLEVDGDEFNYGYMHLSSNVSTSGNDCFENGYAAASYNATTHKITETFTITENCYPTTWRLDRVSICTKSSKWIDFYLNDQENLKFTVTQESFDTEKPVITDISIDKNGEFVTAGDTVTITITVTDNEGLAEDNAYVYIESAASDTINHEKNVSLTLDANTGKYTGTIAITEDTYPSEWHLTQVYIYDKVGNQADLLAYMPNYYNTYPWYYMVTQGASFVEDTQDVNITFSAAVTQSNGSVYSSKIHSTTVKNAPKRASLSDLGVTFPKPEEIEGLTFTGWEVGGQKITEDTPLYFNWYGCDIQATYDKTVVNTSLFYRTKSGSSTIYTAYAYQTFFADKGTTYNEAAAMVELPEDADTAGFTGIEVDTRYIGNSFNGDTEITNYVNFNVKAVYDNVAANIYMNYKSNEGFATSMYKTEVFDKGTTYKEVMDRVELPENADTRGYKGLVMKTVNGSTPDEDAEITEGASISINAEYEEYPVSVYCQYADKDGNAVTKVFKETYLAGTTYKEIYDSLEVPATIDGAEFEKWQIYSGPVSETEEVSLSASNVALKALYKGKTTVVAEYSYRQENGQYGSKAKMYLMDDLPTEAEVIELAGKETNNIKHMSGVTLEEWSSSAYSLGERFMQATFTARYSSYFLTFTYFNGTEPVQNVVAVDKNSEYTLPTENDVYTNIVWYGYEQGAKVKVTGDMSFHLTSGDLKEQNTPTEPDTETPEEPDTETPVTPDTETPAEPDTETPVTPDTETPDTETPVTPDTETPVTPDTETPVTPDTETPAVTLPEEEIASVTTSINEAEEGAVITVPMTGATVVPKQILESARGKDVKVVLDMGGYSWEINGKDINASMLEDINLEVKVDTDVVPTGVVKALAGDKPARQISLTHNGNFGFKANLVLNLGSEHQGEFGNLYYYDSTGKLVFMNAGQIAGDGSVSLGFSHASDYVIVIGENMTPQEDGTLTGTTTVSVTPAANLGQSSGSVTAESSVPKSPKTGE